MPLLQIDASQLEWRTALELSRDAVGIQEVLEGADAHSLNQVAFSLPSRLIAKIYLFRTIFRGSGWSFANDNDFMHVSADSKYWDAVNEKFFKKYEGLDKQHKTWAELVVSGKRLEGPLGRSWDIPMRRNDKGELKIPWTILTNYPVQGTGADVMMIVRISLFNRVQALGLPVKFISTVHDSVLIDCPSEYLQQLVDIAYQVFDDLQLNIKKLYGYEWVVPMTCECKYGPNMKDMQKLARSACNV